MTGSGGCDSSCEAGGTSVSMVSETSSVDEKSEASVPALKLFVEVACSKTANVTKVIGKLMAVSPPGHILVAVCDENARPVLLSDEVVCSVRSSLCAMV